MVCIVRSTCLKNYHFSVPLLALNSTELVSQLCADMILYKIFLALERLSIKPPPPPSVDGHSLPNSVCMDTGKKRAVGAPTGARGFLETRGFPQKNCVGGASSVLLAVSIL